MKRNMPMDLYVAYKLQKRVEMSLKEEREKNLLKVEKKDINETEREKTDIKYLRINCSKCGQHQMWCLCEYQ
jgi:DNA-directed RNA polymerase subunit M/transcription elongation factor TFIIS